MTDGAKEVPCPLRDATRAAPEAPALVGVGGTVSYDELDRRVSDAGKRLTEAGCGPGSRVALYLTKDENYAVLLLALILRVGAVAAPLSTRLPPAGVPPLLETAGCSALVSDDEAVLASADPDVERLRPETLLRDGPPPERETFPTLDPGNPSTIIFTSGSTGVPKAALHTLGNHLSSARGSNANIALVPGDRWLLSLPLYHVGGLSILFRCMLAGATIVLPEPGEPVGGAISRYGVTHVSLVAAQLRRLLEEDAELGGLKALLLGGGPVPDDLVQESAVRSLPLHTSYGLTEMASQVTTTPPGASPEELRTAGRALPHREVSAAADGGILARGETLFAGYVEGDKLIRPIDADGWFRTGDLGVLDKSGLLRVLGRQDNVFVSGGENVMPEEIEAEILRLPGVEEAVVIPVPDETFGERPVAFVRGGPPPETLAAALRERLPRFKVPDTFHPWPSDADTGRMKPDRRFFNERARELSSKL